MKANSISTNKARAIIAALSISLTILTSCHKNYQTGDLNPGVYTISGNASGLQMVPAVTTNGTGTISGTYNINNHVITWTAYWSSLTGAPTSANFYVGTPGSTGDAKGTTWTFYRRVASTDSVSGTMVLTADQASQLINGGWYYTMGTTANAGGEIRGQISSKLY